MSVYNLEGGASVRAKINNAIDRVLDVRNHGFAIDATAAENAAAIVAAHAQGPNIFIPPGDYETDKVTLTGTARLYGKGRLLHPKNSGAILFQPTPGTKVNVSSIGANVQYPNYATQLSTPITVASTTGLSRGKVCLLKSTDTYAYGNGVEKAELIRILEVVGSVVYTHGPIEDTYSTSITLQPLSDAEFVVDGLSFAVDENAYSATTTYGYTGAVECIGAVSPQIRAHFINGLGSGLFLRSCWGARADITAKDLRDVPASNALGYAVAAAAATKYADLTVYAERVRHAYTDGDYGGAGDFSQGVPRLNTVRGRAVNTTAAAWDTHPESHGTHFQNCEAYFGNGDAETTANQSFAFQARGRNVLLTNPVSRGMGGIRLDATTTWGQESHVVVNNPDIQVGAGASATSLSLTAKTSSDNIKLSIFGGRIRGGVPSIANGSPELFVNGTTFEQSSTFRLGQSNRVTLLNTTRISDTSISEAIDVDINTVLTIDNHHVQTPSFIGGSTLVKTGSGTGTAYVRSGRFTEDIALGGTITAVTQGTATLSQTSIEL